MARIPEVVKESELSRLLLDYGLVRRGQGKVRDWFEPPGYSNLLLLLTTNRISIFDFVLPKTLPKKGKVLKDLTVFWLTRILKDIAHHLVAHGPGIDLYLPAGLWENQELQTQTMVVERLEIVPVEAVVRGYLTGSAWEEYQEHGPNLWGHDLSPNLNDGSRLPEPIFTPTTKSLSGHDLPIPIQEFRQRYESLAVRMEQLSLRIYNAAQEHANSRGFLFADTKFEFGLREGWELILADEVLTPDSSRIWDLDQWKEAQKHKKSPPGYDKQPVRDYFARVFKGRDPTNPADLEFVAGLEVPAELVDNTTQRYLQIFEALTG